MQQTLHIFWKDTRRSWPYLAIVFAMTVTLAILTPKWRPFYGHGTSTLNNTVDFLHLLLPVAWWCAIAHLVQAEPLVGDRQFWVTRPYSWKNLAAAKLLFCAVFLVLPLALADCLILAAEGFPPAALLPDLLWRHYHLAAILILPAIVLAALTRGMRQFILACLLLAFTFFVLVELDEFHPSHSIVTALTRTTSPAAASWIEAWGGWLLYACAALALLLWQYARRDTFAVRAIVIAALAWGIASSAWPPSAIAKSGPQWAAVGYPEIAIRFAPERSHLGGEGYAGQRNKIQVDIPVELSGRSRELMEDEMAEIHLTPEGGQEWSSAWNWSIHTTRRGNSDWIELSLDPVVYQRLNRTPVKLHAVFGVVVYEPQSSAKLRPLGEWTEVPGFGAVMLADNFPGTPSLWWRAPLRYPAQKFVYALRAPDSTVLYHGEWSGTYPPVSDWLHISPVVSFAAPFDWREADRRGVAPLPQGVTGEFAVERPIALIRRDLDIPTLRLADYVTRP